MGPCFVRPPLLSQPNGNTWPILHSVLPWLVMSGVFFLWGAYNSMLQISVEYKVGGAHAMGQSYLGPEQLLIKNRQSRPAGVHENIHRDSSYEWTYVDAMSPNFSLAFHQSFGFFDDIPNNEWERLRDVAKSQWQPRPTEDVTNDDDAYWSIIPPRVFYARNYDQNFSCRFEVRVGGTGDGPKFLCDPHRIPRAAELNLNTDEIKNDFNPHNNSTEEGLSYNRKSTKCLVYSIGSGGNFRFETGLQYFLGASKRCEIHVFDGTDHLAVAPKNNDIFFHQWGLRKDHGRNTNDDYSPDENPVFKLGSAVTSMKYRSLSQTMKVLGHSGRTLDVLKIDCEGCEWKTFVDWIRGSSLDGSINVPLPRQVLVETHKSPHPYARKLFDSMREKGYVIFHKEPNIEGCMGDCVEYGFLRLHPDFYL